MKSIGLLLGLIVTQLAMAEGIADGPGTGILALLPGQPYVDVIDYVQVMEDTSLDLGVEDVCCLEQQNNFQKLTLNYIDFGFSDSRFWLKIPVINSGSEPGSWVLSLNTRFMNELAVYWVGEAAPQLLVDDNDTKHFSEREFQYRNLVGMFELDVAEQGYLLVAYRSAGTTALPLTIETQISFYQRWITENTINTAFYAAMSFMVLFSLLHVLILRSKVYLSYACYVGSALLYVFHMNGLSFQYIWPDAPAWNAVGSLYLALVVGMCAVIFSRSFLNTAEKYPALDVMLVSLVGIVVLMVMASWVVSDGLLKKLIFILMSSIALLCCFSGVVVYFDGQKSVRFYIIGWIGVFLAMAILSVTHWVKSLIPVPLSFSISKMGLFFDSMMFSLALADQANEIRIQRDSANAREKKLLEKDLQVHKQMYFLQRQYERVSLLAQKKSLQLASAGYDLRQPIVALRMIMHNIYENHQADVGSITLFRKGFDYIESLITQYLELPKELFDGTVSKISTMQASKAVESSEVFPIQVIFDNITHMFAEDARNKGLIWRCSPCVVMVQASPLVVMRIVSNLVDNAIKYTEKGRVLIGCRRRGDQLEVQVCDTGVGISEQDQQRLMKAFERGDNQDDITGKGLGLAIVSELTQKHHYSLATHSYLSQGTVMSIRLPIFKGNKVADD